MLNKETNKGTPTKLILEDRVHDQPMQIAQVFNDFFIKHAVQVLENNEESLPSDRIALAPQCNESCFFMPSYNNEIIDIIRSLNQNASPGHDNISVKDIRVNANIS